jgi:membrane associated rhomboid family serine protease
MYSERRKAIDSLLYPSLFVSTMWLIKLTEINFNFELTFLGVYPRTLLGFVGIFTAPLIHGDTSHLMSNTLPMLILGIILVFFYRKIALEITFWIYFLSGLWVWISASKGYHLGCSGLIYGIGVFIFFSGIFRDDRKSMGLALLVTVVYGGMIWGVLPLFQNVSWETHLFGAFAGTLCAWFYRNVKISYLAPITKNSGFDPEEQLP